MAPLTWSTPERRSGDRVLPVIANEIYLEIIGYLDPSQDFTAAQSKAALANLALVCRLFCVVCRPHLFNALEISGNRHRRPNAPGTAQFCLSLNFGHDSALSLARYVRSCAIRKWIHHNDRLTSIRGFLDIYTVALSQFLHLETLTLFATPITRDMVASVRSLINLKHLSIESCLFEPDVNAGDLDQLSALRLSKFEFYSARDSPLMPILSAAISAPSLRTLRTDSWLFAHAFMTQAARPPIENLHLQHVLGVDTLRDYLNHTPSIETLSLSYVLQDHPVLSLEPIGIHPTSLPRLRTIRCPPYLLADFTPARPVQSVEISGVAYNQAGYSLALMPMGTETLELLKEPAARIHTLRVPAHLYLSAPVAPALPHLQTLALDLVHPNFPKNPITEPADCAMLVEKICHSWPPATGVRALTIDFGADGASGIYGDLALQHSLLTSEVTHAFPDAKTVRFNAHVEWTRDAQGGWRPAVPAGLRGAVKRCLRALQEIMDVDGCFKSLFAPGEMDDGIGCLL